MDNDDEASFQCSSIDGFNMLCGPQLEVTWIRKFSRI